MLNRFHALIGLEEDKFHFF